MTIRQALGAIAMFVVSTVLAIAICLGWAKAFLMLEHGIAICSRCRFF